MLKKRIIGGLAGGIAFASTIALIDYFRDKEFDLKKFIIGAIVFGIAMSIAIKFKNSKYECL